MFKAKEDDTGKLPSISYLMKGLKVQITENTYTELGFTNGTIGTISKIEIDSNSHVQYCIIKGVQCCIVDRPPTCVILNLENQNIKHKCLQGLASNEIPIWPLQSTFSLSINTADDKSNKRTNKVNIIRRQINIIPAIANTDYKAQSKTLKKIIIGFREPITGSSQWCANYVALTRARSINDILIIGGWTEADINKKPPLKLTDFINRLRCIEQKTIHLVSQCSI